MGDRNTPAPFEPPPWEKEQFEELARKRAASKNDADTDKAVRSLETEAISAKTAPAVGPESVSPAAGGPEARGPVEKIRELPPGADALLAQLKASEPDVGSGLWKTGLVFTAIAGVVGLVLLVWGVTGLFTIKETGAAGVTGGSIMIFFGLFFVGVAVWLAVRIMRQRGVL